MPHVLYDSAEMYNWHDGNKNNLRTVEAQIVPKLKNNEPRRKVTGSYKKKSVYVIYFLAPLTMGTKVVSSDFSVDTRVNYFLFKITLNRAVFSRALELFINWFSVLFNRTSL